MSQSKNPAIIKTLLDEIIKNDFGGDVAGAAAGISAKGLPQLQEKRDYKRLTPAILYAIKKDHSHIKFAHLEIIANYVQVPTGSLLLYSRYRAAKRDNDQNEITELKKHLQDLLTLFEAEDEYSYVEYKKLARKTDSSNEL